MHDGCLKQFAYANALFVVVITILHILQTKAHVNVDISDVYKQREIRDALALVCNYCNYNLHHFVLLHTNRLIIFMYN